jgi:hypothetical protein
MAEEKIKSASLFDMIGGVTDKKLKWETWSESDRKVFSTFMVNRFLSMNLELVEIINEFQKYTLGNLTERDAYRLYHDLLPKRKFYSKYIKGSKEDKYDNDLVQQIAEHYQVSRLEAVEYIDLMPRDTVEHIISLYGYSESDKKRMIKTLK